MKIKNNLLLLTALISGGLFLNGCSSGEQSAQNQTKTTSLSSGSEEEEEEESEKKAETESAGAIDWKNNKGLGPVRSVSLGETVDQAMADAGAVIYKEKCTACHKADKRFIGPAPKGIFERRTPEWIMNMILNPEQMVKEDPIAKQLLIDYNLSPMANQNLTEDEARKVLEYFRTL
ncbi:MAG: cytochrome c [Chitinophagales bacterium]|nr:cytochrome c [Chitinophagales bacterium]